MKITLPSQEQINKAKDKSPWDFGNKQLYTLCENDLEHNDDGIILAKVKFIGRIYAAAIERGEKTEMKINDNFYLTSVIPVFRDSDLGKKLTLLKKYENINNENIGDLLDIHKYLMIQLNTIISGNKRSFCSKYLHFHLPDLFFIYDSRALLAIRKFIPRVPKEFNSFILDEKIDSEYAKYFCKCYYLKNKIENEYKLNITNRQFDNILMEVANEINKLKLDKLKL